MIISSFGKSKGIRKNEIIKLEHEIVIFEIDDLVVNQCRLSILTLNIFL